MFSVVSVHIFIFCFPFQIVYEFGGQILKLQVENLTEAASIDDIQLFIGCAECKLKTFTSKGINVNHLIG
jgi:hypothetical protein